MFTMLFPIKIVEINASYCSASLQAAFARLFPFSAKVRSFVRFKDEKAVSVDEK